MKKRLVSLMLAVTMVASLGACGKSKDTSSADDTTNKEISAEEYWDTVKKNAEVYKKYIKLPEYNGVEVDVDKDSLEVTDSEINEYIDNALSNYSTEEKITEGVTKEGDTINLDYSGKLDGVAFDGGTATEVTYVVGSGQYIEDLDKGLVGLEIGKEYDIPCTFPETYQSTDLAGKDVIFTVKVNSISNYILPELTDEWVLDNKDTMGVKSENVEDFKKEVNDYLVNSHLEDYNVTKYSSIMEKVMSSVEISDYPEKELNSLVDIYVENTKSSFETYKAQYQQQGIESFEDYLKQAVQVDSEDEFRENCKETCKQYLAEKMVITIIAVENNLEVSADDINNLGEEWASYYQYDSYQAIIDQYGKAINAEVGFESLTSKVSTYLCEKAVEVESQSTEETTAAQ